MTINIYPWLYSRIEMIYASFARPVGLFDNWFNRVVSKITGGDFCHSEFIVSWDSETAKKFFSTLEGHDKLKDKYGLYEEDGLIHICFYVLWGDRCAFRLLKYNHNNPFYRFPNEQQFELVPLETSEENEFTLSQFLLNQCKKPYDYAGALFSWMPLRYSDTEYPSYYCSQLMICALQNIRMHQEVNPSGYTPNALYKLLKS